MNADDAQRALNALEQHQPKRAKFFLRRAFGEETKYEEVGGHIFKVVERKDREETRYQSRECTAIGCELMETHSDWEDIKQIAHELDCPAPMEAIDVRLPDQYI